MTSDTTLSEVLASGLAALILHDMSGPASGVLSGLELLGESGIADAEALDLAASSARTLRDLIEFHRIAFGHGAGAMAAETLARLAGAPFASRRARLEWAATLDPFPPGAAQAMLIMIQIAAAALAAGGVARATADVSSGELVLRIDGEGSRAALHPDTVAGLGGRDLPAGLAGRWAPARFLFALVERAQGAVSATADTGRFTMTARFPAAG